MRHANPIGTSMMRHGQRIFQPYSKQYLKAYENTQFASANPNKTYVKVMQYIADNDGCKRVDVNINVLGWKRHVEAYGKKRTSSCSRGQHSNMYAALLYLDLIDYDKNFCYHITKKGLEILKTAYENQIMSKYFKAQA